MPRGFSRNQKVLIEKLERKFGPVGYSVYKMTSRSRRVIASVKVNGEWGKDLEVNPGEEAAAYEKLCLQAGVAK